MIQNLLQVGENDFVALGGGIDIFGGRNADEVAGRARAGKAPDAKQIIVDRAAHEQIRLVIHVGVPVLLQNMGNVRCEGLFLPFGEKIANPLFHIFRQPWPRAGRGIVFAPDGLRALHRALAEVVESRVVADFQIADAIHQRAYADIERGERGSSEEHLTVTQFKAEREQERLADLTEKTEQKEKEAASLEKKIEKVQKQQIAVQSVEKIEAKSVPLSSKVMLERSEYENLAMAAKKFYVQERKESKLQKALDAAYKLIAELKAKVSALTAELSEYKSIRNKLNAAGLEQENETLRGKLRSYETVIERNNLWHFFGRNRAKAQTRGDAR